MPAATLSIDINAPREKVFSVLSDYARYGEFLPEVKNITVVSKAKLETVVEYEVQIVKRIRYTLRHLHQPPGKISWTFVKGDFIKDNRGSWELKAVDETHTRATYTIEMKLGALVPNAVVKALVEKSLPALLSAVKKRSE